MKNFNSQAFRGLIACLIVLVFTAPGQSKQTTKQCTLHIKGDHTEFKETQLLYSAAGHASAYIDGQDSKIEADSIEYNDVKTILEAKGHVRIIRNKCLTTGGKFRFEINSDEYLITEPHSTVVRVSLAPNKE